jgi:hypothetical protein
MNHPLGGSLGPNTSYWKIPGLEWYGPQPFPTRSGCKVDGLTLDSKCKFELKIFLYCKFYDW